MRIVFMGSPDFAVPALEALAAPGHDAGHDIVCVYAQPPRPKGRGQKETPCPVHARADAMGLNVRTPGGLRGADETSAFGALHADVCVVAAYGHILPREILDAPKFGCVNIHASLLPRWRGAAPIQRAIEAGDDETGISIMQMAEGLDTGPVLAREALPIGADDDAGCVHDALSALGARMIIPALRGLAAGTLTGGAQDESRVTYAEKITKAEARLDFNAPAGVLARRVRAFAPFPGAWFQIEGGARIKVLAARAEPGADGSPGEAPGEVIDDRLGIQTAQGVFRPLRVKPEGGKAMDTDAFLRGHPARRGARAAGIGLG